MFFGISVKNNVIWGQKVTFGPRGYMVPKVQSLLTPCFLIFQKLKLDLFLWMHQLIFQIKFNSNKSVKVDFFDNLLVYEKIDMQLM